MGYKFQQVCYESVFEAANAYVLSLPVSTRVVNEGLESYRYSINEVFEYGEVQLALIKELNGDFVSGALVTYYPPECDPSEPVIDGLLLGWAIGACLISAFVFRMFKRAAL